MKSSTALKLTLMMGGAAATLAFCSETQQSFSSVASCVEAGNHETLCRSAHEAALAEHMRTAPTFASLQECQAKLDVDQCTSLSKRDGNGNVGNVIMPLMAGYMLNQHINNRRDDPPTGGSGYGSRYYHGGHYYGGTPLYQSRRTPGSYWAASELKDSSSQARKPNIRTTTVSRSGFGGRAFSGSG